MAKLEWDIIVERVKAGMRKAKEQGKRIGRPKAAVDVLTIISLREQGLSLQSISDRVKYKDSKGRSKMGIKIGVRKGLQNRYFSATILLVIKEVVFEQPQLKILRQVPVSQKREFLC